MHFYPLSLTAKRGLAKSFRRLRLCGGSLFTVGVWALLASFPFQVRAQSGPVLPHGGNFVAGLGAIGAASSGSLSITQSSARGVIDWSSFSIGAGGRVFLNNGSGATLSRVTGSDLSRIDGLLKATGSLYLINSNGLVIGAKGCVLTDGSFVASTRNIATNTFMAGDALTASGSSLGGVVNQGSILARNGDVILIGRSVENSGSIQAPNGTATLATGDSVLLTTVGGPSGVYVSPDTKDAGTLTQSGRIEAAAAALKAGGGDIYTLAGNRTGLISATGTKTINGEVWLSAPSGKVVADGSISARNVDGSGGRIVANGAAVTVGNSARISAAGSSGGSVLVGVSQPGGTDLAAWTTIADGASILAGGPAGGGLVETSGHAVSIGKANISAGKGGLWRVDPTDLTIDTSAAATIISALNAGSDVSEQTTATTVSGSGVQTAGAGDINVAAPISWTGAGALNLSAYHNLNINAAVAGAGGFTGVAGVGVSVNANVTAATVLMKALGGDLTLGSGVTVSGATGVTLQTAGRFINNSGANALAAGSGRWLVYSSDPSMDLTNGLAPDFLQYAATTATTPAASGNGLLYSATPNVSVAVSGTVEKTYDGTTSAIFNNANATVSGLINSDAAAVSGSYASKNAGSGIAVTASSVAVTHNGVPVYGYGGTAPSVSANIGLIDPATLTASIVGDPTKTYNATTTATLSASNYQLSGFAAGEGATVNQPSSVAYDSAEAGARTISAAFSPTNFVANGGTSLSNYVLPASATGPGQINQAPLLITGVLATDKVYDRTAADTLNTGSAALYGIINSDNVSLVSGSAAGTFSAANAGSNLPVTASGFTLSGSKAADYALVQPAGLTASISPASLSVSGVSAVNKVYDATTVATLNTSSVTLNGVLSGDVVSLGTSGATGSFSGSDVGTAIPVSTSGFIISGAASSNYRVAQPGGLFADITAKPLSLAIVSTPTKVYNGDAGAIVNSSGFSLSGFVSGQSGAVGQAAHVAYATPNAGTQSVTATLAVSDYTAGSGTKLSNYLLPISVTGTGVIDPAPITISINGNPTKTYDGTVAALLNSSNYLLNGFLSGQSATVTQTSGVYDSPNAGSRSVSTTLGTGDFTAGSGTILSNYAFPTVVTGFGTIVPAPLAGSIYAAITGVTKSYDGTTVATLNPANFVLSGFMSGDGATVTQTVGQYASKNVGVQPVTASLAPGDFNPNSGTDFSNYTLPTAAYGSGTINPAVLSASIVGTPTKVYNGTTRATLTNPNFSIAGLAPGESINISDAVQAAYDARQAGARTITSNIAATDISAGSGTLLSNYVLPTSASGAGQITQAPLSILGVAAQNKTYDTTTAATLATGGANLFGVVGADNVALSSSGASGVFASPNASNGVPVSASGFSISGSDAANYQLFQPTGLAANIFRAPLTITGVNAQNKNYDNTTAATLNSGSAALAGVLAPDNGQVGLDASAVTAAFSSVNVGNNLAVSAGGFSLNGAQASNYALSQPGGLTANIDPALLFAQIIGNPTKVYDGSASTTLRAANYNLVGFVAGQGASVPQSAEASYQSPDAGLQPIASTLASSDFVANSGTNLSNYILPTSGSGMGTITQAPLTAAIINNPIKTYDSTTTATLASSNYTLNGFIAGQSATVTQTAGLYNVADAGTRSVSATLGGGDFAAGGATNLNNYVLPVSATGTGTINKAPLQVVSVAGTNRSYNGGVADTLNVSTAGVMGLFGSDAVNLNTAGATGVFASKDAGTGIGVTASGFTISGGQSADYSLAQPTGLSADITRATLNLTNVTRAYDSLMDLPTASSAYTLGGVFGPDAVSVNASGISGSYADKNVNTNKSVSLSGLALTGAQAADYTIASSLTNANIGTITKAPLTVVGVVADNKVYDATTHAGLDNSSATFGGLLFAGDDVTLNTTAASATFNNKNVGTGKPVTATGYTASGTDFGNYNFTQPTGLSANITPFTGISLSSVTKIYDGGTTLPPGSAAYGLAGVLASDNVQVATGGLSGGYGSVNVGTNLLVSLSGLALTGTDAANYSIGSTVSNQPIGLINPKSLSAAIIGTPTKTYDTLTSASLTPANFNLTGFVPGESATVTKTSGTYSSANAGTPTVSTSLAAGDFTQGSGTLLTNYILPVSASGGGKINAAPLSITGVLATDKIYNGNVTDVLNTSSAALSGVFAADSSLVTLNSAGALGTFASPNFGTAIPVTASAFTIGGTKASNYTLAQPTGLSANIAQAMLNLASVTKTYDATDAAVGAGVSYTLSGIVGADVVSLNTSGLTGTYSTKNVGTGIGVSLTGLSLTGARAANYSIASSVSNDLIGTITKAPLSVSGALAVNKVYDGTTAAAIDNSGAALVGVLGSDTVNLSSPNAGTFASANAGSWAVTAGSAYSVSGTDAGNYLLSQPTGFSARITPAPLTAAIIGNPTRTYNGLTGATLNASNYALSGFVGGQSATVGQTVGLYDSADAGTRTVTAGLTSPNFTAGSGTLLSNYVLPTTASGTGTINQKALSAAILGNPTKTYNATTAASLAAGNFTLGGFIAGQGATVTQTVGTYDTADAGARTVTASLGNGDFSATGPTNLANYLLPTSATGAGTINQKTLTAAITGDPTRIYNGTSAATLAASDYTLNGFVAGQGATVNQTSGIYDSADAGARTVTASLGTGDFSATGATNLANYVLPITATGAGTINQKTLTAAITGDPTRIYNGNNAATLAASDYTLSGFVTGQNASVTQTAGSYDSADAGARTVTASLGAGDFSPTGGTNLANYMLPVSASGVGTINQKALAAAITGNPSRTYDGTTNAALISGDYTLSGFVTGQGATVTQSAGAYDAADAGARTVTASLGTGDFSSTGGTNLANYLLPTSAAGAGVINQKTLAAAITGNPTRTYDATTSANLTSSDYTLSGFVAGQGATVSQSVGTYDAPDAGSRTVTAALSSGDIFNNSGTNLANYILPTTASGAGTINQKALNAAISGSPSRIYDGTVAATLAPGDYTLTGFLAGQGATVTQSAGTYDSSNAGARSVTATLGLNDFSSNGGTNLSNYALPTAATGVGEINPKILTAAISGNPTRAYDGTAAATLMPGDYTVSGFVAGQGSSVTQTAGIYDSADAGVRTVTASLSPSDFAANSGTSLSNYVLPASASGAGTISPKALSAAITSNPTRTYDGTTAATLASADYALSGFVNGQGALVTQTAGNYDTANAGSRTVSASLSGTDFAATTGTNLANYALPATATGAGTIDPKALAATVTGNPTKAYDGTNLATLVPGDYTLAGFIAGQGANVTQTAGAFDNANAGSHSVTAALGTNNFSAATGTNLGNYILPSNATGVGTIDPKALTASIVDVSKIYDGATSAVLAAGNFVLSGFAPGQNASITQTAGSYASANAGQHGVTAALSANDFVLNGGAIASNYVLPISASGTGLINPKLLTASITGMPGKTYDGNTSALLGSGDYTLNGFVAGQDATITQSAGLYDSANAGSRMVAATLRVGDFTAISGTSLGNYLLPVSATGPGTIERRLLTAVIVGDPTRMSNGTLTANLMAGNFTLKGFIAGQGATVTQTLGVYDAAQAGSRTVTALLAAQNFNPYAGTLLANYVLPVSAMGGGALTPAILTNAPTLADAIISNMTIRNMASATQIATTTAQAAFGAAVPRTYIPYPAPSTLSTWQNNGFGSLPSIVSTTEASTGGAPIINTTEQILLQGGKEKSWHLVLPPPRPAAVSTGAGH